MIIYDKLFWTHSTEHGVMLTLFPRTSKIDIHSLDWKKLRNIGIFKKRDKEQITGIYNELELVILKGRIIRERYCWALWLRVQIILFISVQICPSESQDCVYGPKGGGPSYFTVYQKRFSNSDLEFAFESPKVFKQLVMCHVSTVILVLKALVVGGYITHSFHFRNKLMWLFYLGEYAWKESRNMC